RPVRAEMDCQGGVTRRDQQGVLEFTEGARGDPAFHPVGPEPDGRLDGAWGPQGVAERTGTDTGGQLQIVPVPAIQVRLHSPVHAALQSGEVQLEPSTLFRTDAGDAL